MNPLQWRLHNLKVYLYELIPSLITWLFNKIDCEVSKHRFYRLKPQQRACGFSYNNVLVLEVELKHKTPLVVKLPCSDVHDLIRVGDVWRVFTAELVDSILSVRANAYPFTFGWCTPTRTIVWNEVGTSLVNGEMIYFPALASKLLPSSWLDERGLWCVLSSAKENGPALVISENQKLKLPLPMQQLTPFRQWWYTSLKKWFLVGKPEVTSNVLKALEEFVDFWCIYNGIDSLESLLKYTIDSMLEKNSSSLVGSNLEFKRLRLWEGVAVVLQRKLMEIIRTQQRQKEFRVDSDFLLKSMTVTPLVRRFETLSLLNPFAELSLKHKVSIPLEWVPYELRSVHPTFASVFDVYDTPDDENVGVKLYLTPDAKIGERGELV